MNAFSCKHLCDAHTCVCACVCACACPCTGRDLFQADGIRGHELRMMDNFLDR
jgi:hypothetical protein